MYFKELLTGDLQELDSIYINTKKLNLALEEEKQYIIKEYAYILNFITLKYKNLTKNIMNKTFKPVDFIIGQHSFSFLGYNENNYLIYEEQKNKKRFLINEDLNQTFFYILDNNNLITTRFSFDIDFLDFSVSFFSTKDSFILVGESSPQYSSVSFSEIIVEFKENKNELFKNISQFEFYDYKIKSIKTSEKFKEMFNSNPVYKICFKRTAKNIASNCKVYYQVKNKNVYNSYEYTSQIRRLENTGINLFNPIYTSIDDIELFELNYQH